LANRQHEASEKIAGSLLAVSISGIGWLAATLMAMLLHAGHMPAKFPLTLLFPQGNRI